MTSFSSTDIETRDNPSCGIFSLAETLATGHALVHTEWRNLPTNQEISAHKMTSLFGILYCGHRTLRLHFMSGSDVITRSGNVWPCCGRPAADYQLPSISGDTFNTMRTGTKRIWTRRTRHLSSQDRHLITLVTYSSIER